MRRRWQVDGGAELSGVRAGGYGCVLLLAVCLCAWSAAMSAFAQSGETSTVDARRQVAAQDARKRAQAAEGLGYHDEAARWLEAAYRYQSRPEDLLRAALAYQQAKHYATAATLCLTLVGLEGNPAAQAKRLLDQLQRKLTLVEVECSACRIELDGKPLWTPRFYTDPGQKHVIVVEQPSGHLRREFVGKKGQTVAIAAPPPAPPPAEVKAEVKTVAVEGDKKATLGTGTGDHSAESGAGAGEDTDWRRGPFAEPVAMTGLPPLVAYIGIGTSVALLGTSLGITLHARGGVQAFEDAAAEARDCTLACDALVTHAKTLLAAGRRKELLATVGWVAAGTVSAVVLAIALFLTDWEGGADETDAGLSVEPSPSGVGLRIRF